MEVFALLYTVFLYYYDESIDMKNDFPDKRLQLSLRFTEVAVYFLKSQNE